MVRINVYHSKEEMQALYADNNIVCTKWFEHELKIKKICKTLLNVLMA
jgi:hypothetical protein